MTVSTDIAEVVALISDPVRANMLSALLRCQPLKTTELARKAGVKRPIAGAHLGRLRQAGLVSFERQGGHRHYRLASPAVADALSVVADDAPPRHGPALATDPAMRLARTCYDHLAGELGVELADAFVGRGLVAERGDDFVVTPAGEDWFGGIGIDIPALRRTRRALARRCHDRSEGRPHVGGALGAAIARRLFANGWVERTANPRGVVVTRAGRHALRLRFGIENPGSLQSARRGEAVTAPLSVATVAILTGIAIAQRG